MSVPGLIEAVKEGDLSRARQLLDDGVDVNGHGDEQEWTALNYASGRGDADMVRLLVERGANVFNVGKDVRTPYEIALAAGHVEVAQFLREVEEEVDSVKAKTSSRKVPKYCKAYYLRDLRQFPGWRDVSISLGDETTGARAAGGECSALPGDEIVFIHTDFRVTRLMWHDEDVLFDRVTPEWKTFCVETLKFRVPDDLEYVAQMRRATAHDVSH